MNEATIFYNSMLEDERRRRLLEQAERVRFSIFLFSFRRLAVLCELLLFFEKLSSAVYTNNDILQYLSLLVLLLYCPLFAFIDPPSRCSFLRVNLLPSVT